MFPGCGSQCTQPQLNICALNSSTMVFIIDLTPPLRGTGYVEEGWVEGIAMALGAEATDEGVLEGIFGSRSPISRRIPTLSLSRTPSIHSAVMILLVESSG